MMLAQLALLLGLLGVPVCLVWLGHRIGELSAVGRGAFWGGVIGHTAALLIAVLALHFPPVPWSGGPRVVLAFWSMLGGGVVGALVGAVHARGR